MVLDHEIACLDVTPLAEGADRTDVCAVGMWTDMSLRILHLPSLSQVTKESLHSEIIPRSILFATLAGVQSLASPHFNFIWPHEVFSMLMDLGF